MATTIVTKSGSGAPTASDLVAGELAVDLTNKRLYTEDSGGTILEVGSNPYNFTANHDGSAKLATTATGIDVTGTVTADGLTVNSGAENLVATFQSTDTEAQIALVDTTGTSTIRARNDFRFHVNNAATPALKIDSNNDISFYEDTGTTPKFFWDSSAEALGIGTSSPEQAIHVKTAVNNTAVVRIESTATDSYPTLSLKNDAREYQLTAHGPLGDKFTIYDGTAGSHRFVIDSSGNVDIKTVGSAASPSLHFGGDSDTGLFKPISNTLAFSTFGTERMRIDSSGNLMVSDTTANPSGDNVDSGIALHNAGLVRVSTNNAAAPLDLNVKGRDGTIAEFRKDGTAVGSIGTEGGDLTIGNADTGLQFVNTSQIIRPQNLTTNAAVDAQVSLGQSAYRFKDLYLSGGVYLGGTGAANKLSDFETGTWTPTVTSSAGTITTVTSEIGTYTKIGRLVTLQYQFNIATLGTASGNCIVSGMPFTEDNTEITYYAGVHRARSGASSITEFDPAGTLQLYGTTPVAGVYLGSMVYNTTS
jgi:hypothetical protein